jgi:hypothetical protein
LAAEQTNVRVTSSSAKSAAYSTVSPFKFVFAGICAAIGLSTRLGAAALLDIKLCRSGFAALFF